MDLEKSTEKCLAAMHSAEALAVELGNQAIEEGHFLFALLQDGEGLAAELFRSTGAEINNLIDYKVYDKFRKYSINWVKWDNFLSYGEGNFFDFSNLKGLILLNGEPANQSGKTTFAIDLIHFLLFGRTDRTSTQDKIFNRFLPESTKVTVEGSITIDGVEYIINRELKRTSFDKRTSASRTNQKVKYYRVITEGQLEELEENLSVDKSYVSSVRAGKALIALGGLVLLGIPVAVITLNFPLVSGLLLASPITSFLGIKGFGLVEGSDTLYTDQKNENKHPFKD